MSKQRPTVRQFLQVHIAFLDDATVAAALNYVLATEKLHWNLTHVDRAPYEEQLNQPENMVYHHGRRYVRAQLPGVSAWEPLRKVKLSSVQRQLKVEFSAAFVEAFNAVAALEAIAEANDAEFESNLQEWERRKLKMLADVVPW